MDRIHGNPWLDARLPCGPRLHAQLLPYVIQALVPFSPHACSTVGITKNLFMDFLVDGYLFNKKMWDQFDVIMASIKWPSGIVRLPTNVSVTIFADSCS